ncbi:glutamyl-tRNA reductase [Exilibacterium tricleocarpae]|uniref:Glutamyl-tRNA reductase n=1 Tax=Exilibacterium tricleocarpae TaxID=2591008 RepID=A0A545U5W2_9GAMM|nr:glutamyl-tRNA reductase [Exilibacterium tricleocarpae]TQV84793.1 glutamyl-tRNA reductase [Exilibacterium tricleocarpae]
MALLAFGINHNTASLALRERVAFAPEQMSDALADVQRSAGLEEVAILSTCNRTEIYACAQAAGVEPSALLMEWLARYHHLSLADIEPYHYWHRGEAAIRHMMKVACGLDSLVLGEPQILGQMKSAYAVAHGMGTIRAKLHGAFQQVFSIAKRVRTETAIGENPVSVAYAAVSLASQIFSDLKQDTALLIGAGETIELVARHLSQQGVRKIIVANRTLGRAEELARRFGAEAILLADIPEQLYRADIVVSSTASQLPLLGKGAVESALKRRKHQPIFMVDIAVPRDIEAEVGELEDVYLYTVDDLREVIEENRKSRREAARKADTIIDQGVALYLDELRALNSVSTIKAYRRKAEVLRDEELAKAQRLLQSGGDPEQVLAQLARNLTNKLLHTPTAKLKQASATGRSDMIGVTQELFELTQDDMEQE